MGSKLFDSGPSARAFQIRCPDNVASQIGVPNGIDHARKVFNENTKRA